MPKIIYRPNPSPPPFVPPTPGFDTEMNASIRPWPMSFEGDNTIKIEAGNFPACLLIWFLSADEEQYFGYVLWSDVVFGQFVQFYAENPGAPGVPELAVFYDDNDKEIYRCDVNFSS